MSDDSTSTIDDTDSNRRADGDRRAIVRDRYAEIATDEGCCGGSREAVDVDRQARGIGYTDAELSVAPDGANLGLGCGNPSAIAGLRRGETVLDLGSGGGFDCFLAAREVGEDGRVIGVDMTPEMIETARENAAESDVDNVTFRLGEIEHLPVADETVDVVISNCVVNLSPDKPQVFREAYRVLRPGGRVSISDVVRTAPLPDSLRDDPDAIAGCIAGAASIDALESMLSEAGFEGIDVDPKGERDRVLRDWDDEHDPSRYLASANIEARKPRDA